MRFISKSYAVALLGTLAAILALANSGWAAEAVNVGNAWVRATAPGQQTAGAYMELVSATDAALVGVDTPVAARAELHSMRMDGGVMRMRALDKIDLPARKAVKLSPGGLHVMLLDIKRPLKAGDKVPLTLTVRAAGAAPLTIRVEAEVRAVGAAAHSTGH